MLWRIFYTLHLDYHEGSCGDFGGQVGKMLLMAVANGLELNQDPDRPILTELENNLIAQTINFQTIFLFQKFC